MKDKNDTKTIDLINKKTAGRPRTSTPEKKKADAAARAKRYREKNKKLDLEQIHKALYFLAQNLNWEENCFLEDGSFADEYKKEDAQTLRTAAMKNVIDLCELLNQKELEKKLKHQWGEEIGNLA